MLKGIRIFLIMYFLKEMNAINIPSVLSQLSKKNAKNKKVSKCKTKIKKMSLRHKKRYRCISLQFFLNLGINDSLTLGPNKLT